MRKGKSMARIKKAKPAIAIVRREGPSQAEIAAARKARKAERMAKKRKEREIENAS
jgi:hypothetical protein